MSRPSPADDIAAMPRLPEAEVAIRAQELSKRFLLNHERRMALKERFVRGKSPESEEFWALRDATFDVPKGSMFGIIGHNGSGKSTALKVIAGIYRPTSGSVRVTGKLSALLELGAGFHPELTGRENIVLNASILGMTKQQIAESMEDIIEFAGLGRFIDSPIKTYSSGMYVRLGFAVAVKVNPEILVIDEVIAVGDEDFQRKCFDYIHELRQRGSTIVIVTHSMGIVTDRCDYAMWLDHGEVQAIGDARSVVDAYMHKVNSDEAERGGQEAAEGAEGAEVVVRRGSGDVRIVGVELFGPTGESSVFLINGKPGTMRLHFEAKEATKNVIFGFGFFTEAAVNVAGPNSRLQGAVEVKQGTGYADFSMPEVLLASGTYATSAAIMAQGSFLDYLDRFFEVRVRPGSSDEPGLITMPGQWGGSSPRPEPTGAAPVEGWNAPELNAGGKPGPTAQLAPPLPKSKPKSTSTSP